MRHARMFHHWVYHGVSTRCTCYVLCNDFLVSRRLWKKVVKNGRLCSMGIEILRVPCTLVDLIRYVWVCKGFFSGVALL